MTPDPERAPGLRHRRRRPVPRIDLRSQLRLLQKPHVRHSREGGNLVSISGQDWIPAFAGMTRTGRSRVCTTASASRLPPQLPSLPPRGRCRSLPLRRQGAEGEAAAVTPDPERAPGLRHRRRRRRPVPRLDLRSQLAVPPTAPISPRGRCRSLPLRRQGAEGEAAADPDSERGPGPPARIPSPQPPPIDQCHLDNARCSPAAHAAAPLTAR